MRFFALSDLHVDYPDNEAWVRALPKLDYRPDVLLLAGDLSSDFSRLEDVLLRIRDVFAEVFFVPGNHDLWVRRGEGLDSLGKFERIMEFCARADIKTASTLLGSVRVVPLLSWYDFSFGMPGTDLLSRWADFRMCVWPAGMELPEVAVYFHSRNLPEMTLPAQTVISMSHFLPRPDVLPQRVDPAKYFLTPVLGSKELGIQVERINPLYHVFGHSHLNSLRKLGGISYLNNAFGYPSETRITRKALVELPLGI